MVWILLQLQVSLAHRTSDFIAPMHVFTIAGFRPPLWKSGQASNSLCLSNDCLKVWQRSASPDWLIASVSHFGDRLILRPAFRKTGLQTCIAYPRLVAGSLQASRDPNHLPVGGGAMLLPSVCYNSDFAEFGIGQTLGSAERKSDQCRVQCDVSHHFNWAITAKPRPSVKRKLLLFLLET